MIELLLIVGLSSVIIGGILGYLIGYYQSSLLREIKELRARKDPEPPKELPTPAVTMGAYASPPVIANTDTERVAGIVETKTPELLDFESREAIKKQVLGQ